MVEPPVERKGSSSVWALGKTIRTRTAIEDHGIAWQDILSLEPVGVLGELGNEPPADADRVKNKAKIEVHRNVNGEMQAFFARHTTIPDLDYFESHSARTERYGFSNEEGRGPEPSGFDARILGNNSTNSRRLGRQKH
jgi:hypothetical protein